VLGKTLTSKSYLGGERESLVAKATGLLSRAHGEPGVGSKEQGAKTRRDSV